MPYLTCPTCRLAAHSAARHATTDRCSRCDGPLAGAERADGVLRGWKVADLRLATRREAQHEFG
jgi:ribosomal protein L34E